MLTLLKNMLKEEFRIHTAMFSKWLFFIFPLIITLASVLISISISTIDIPTQYLILLAHGAFLFYGLSVGSFGLNAKDALKIRLGNISFLAYSSKILPISPKKVFMIFAIKDILFYLAFTIIPVIIGIAITSLIINIYTELIPILFVSLTLSFLYGLSLSFLISVLYSRSRQEFLIASSILTLALIITKNIWLNPETIISYFHPIAYFTTQSTQTLGYSLITPLILFAISIFLLETDEKNTHRDAKDLFKNLEKQISKRFQKTSSIISKDIIDMHRSIAGFSKIIFSFIIPISIVWFMLWFISETLVPIKYSILTFALIIGIVSTSIYNWLNEFDSLENYRFLPVSIKNIMDAKINLYLLISLISSSIILLTIVLSMNKINLIFDAFIIMITSSIYVFSVLIYVAGLTPNIAIYDAKIFVKYLAYNLPVLVTLYVITLADLDNTTMILLPLSLFILYIASKNISKAKKIWTDKYFK
ncbi:MAG: hypothetical protein K0B02_05300 [DPANN group archaeon]|nr:hypothetical protein [DPANN group archaeon]